MKITLRGREIPLLYTTYEMKTIQEEICPLGEVFYALFGRNKDDENDKSGYAGPKHLETVAKLIRILGNAGLEGGGSDGQMDPAVAETGETAGGRDRVHGRHERGHGK